jgi:hypothetical protein
MFIVLDNTGGLDQFAEDWEAANDLAGVSGGIVHWYEGRTNARGTYGFETIVLGPLTERSVWLTFGQLGIPAIKVTPSLNPNEVRFAMPMSGAEFVRGRCCAELAAIQALLVDHHPAEIEDDIRTRASWLSAGGGMKVGSQLSLFGREVAEEAVVFEFPDQSQLAVTARSIHVAPMTFVPQKNRRILWGMFGTG